MQTHEIVVREMQYIAFDRPREPVEERAASHVSRLLMSALEEGGVAQLKREGALLTEDRAIDLALGT